MPKDLLHSRFQFSLAALLATVTVVGVLFSSIACNELASTLVGLPIALGAMTVLLGGQTRGLRRMCLVLAACGMVLFLLLAGASYPFIVIADSDLGLGAMDTREAIPIALSYTSDGGTLVAVDRERVAYWKTSPNPVPVSGSGVLNGALLTWIIFAARGAGTEHATATISARHGTE